ncbi:hypothetical protein AB0L70_39950 [Kribbella sp. NPDC051952]|uniref:hypothetical protein n=1 Tax=Kribbella sp. NPDC051952 TaxID=3154851 RepID=UPI00343BCA7A
MSFRVRRADESVAHEFATACTAGSVAALRGMLAPEAVVVSDGGGKVAAELHPTRGADAVARRITEALSRQPGTALSVEAVNGQAGVVLRRAGAVVAVVSLSVAGAKIAAVWIVLNPDKLRHWAVRE